MENYNPRKVEDKWRKKWLEENRWQVNLEEAENPYYNLMMFPYPSAEGLHVGNLYAFVGSDIHGRYMRMRGYDVFEPIGFDAFGIHSENFAIKKGVHPRDLIKESTSNFRSQLEKTGNIYSWREEVNTTHPGYYKWTQWLFLQFHKAGLAYLKEAPAQWCPSCKTVLANEQVIAGKCERCDALVEEKYLKQWFLKITNYADRLLDNLSKIDWSEKTKTAQANWIGRSYGWRVKFSIHNSARNHTESDTEQHRNFVEVFTTRPDTLFGATYLVLAPEHHLVEKLKDSVENRDDVESYVAEAKKKTQEERTAEEGNGSTQEKTGVELKGVEAVNPANNERIPVWIADYVLVEYGTGAIMAVPAHDERDFEFAEKYNLAIRPVITPEERDKQKNAYEGEGELINSGKFTGMRSKEAKEKIGEYVEGNSEVHYHLRDWLISRQRYWGPPIPVIYCRRCRKSQISNYKLQTNSNNQNSKVANKLEEGIDYTTIDGEEYAIVPVPEESLPVELPYLEDYKPRGTGQSPLAQSEEFARVKCPECGDEAKRETDVSDTFLDSCWYFLRYPSRDIEDAPWREDRTKKWLPVDMYIGGQEHAVLHLMYARFITMFLYDRGFLHFDEPFKKFRAHGLLIREGAKISKSRGNVINPDDFFEAYGVDTVRTYLMFLSPFQEGGDWRDEGVKGVHRFLGRVWGIVQDNKQQITNNRQPTTDNQQQTTSNRQQNSDLERVRHQTIKKVTEDIEQLRYNTAIASMMSYLNELEAHERAIEHTKTLLVLLAPFAPYITEELWHRLAEVEGEEGSIHNQPWPEYDEEKTKESTITIPVQVNGKVRAQIETERGTNKEELEKLALKNEKIKEILEGGEPDKVIAVPDKIVNIVIK